MPLSESTVRTSNQLLTQLTQLYTGRDKFIASLVAPVIPVKKKKVEYYVWGRDHEKYYSAWMSPKGKAQEVDSGVTTTTKTLRKKALKEFLADEIADESDSPLPLEKGIIEGLAERLYRSFEVDCKNLLEDTSNVGTSNSATTAWDANSTSGTGTIQDDINTAKQTILLNTGKVANSLIVTDVMYDMIMGNPEIKEHYQALRMAGVLTDGELPGERLFGLKFIKALGVVDESAKNVTASRARIWSDTLATVAYINPRPVIGDHTWAVTLQKQNYQQKQWRPDEPEGVWHLIERTAEAVVVDPECAYQIIADY